MGTKNTSNAQQRLISCECCDPYVVTPFKWLLGEMGETVSDPARCPACNGQVDEDTLVSFREDSVYFDPPIERSTIRLIGEYLRATAQKMIRGCEHCCDCTEATFDCILDELTGCDPTCTEYLLCRPAQCPHCLRDVNERTLILPCV